jgi:hypothetical protein
MGALVSAFGPPEGGVNAAPIRGGRVQNLEGREVILLARGGAPVALGSALGRVGVLSSSLGGLN